MPTTAAKRCEASKTGDAGDVLPCRHTADETAVLHDAESRFQVDIELATETEAADRGRGHLSDAIQSIDEAVRRADQTPGKLGHRYPIHPSGDTSEFEIDRLDAARATIGAGTRLGDELGVGWHRSTYKMVQAVERFVAGDWDDAVAEVEATISLGEETGETYAFVTAEGVLSLISLHRNDLHGAEAAIATAASRVADGPGFYHGQWALWARARLRGQGRERHAFMTLAAAWDHYAQLGLELEYPILGPDLVRLALVNEERGRAHEVAAAVAEVASGDQVLSIAGAALHCRGLVDDDSEILDAAVADCARSPRPFELGRVCEDAGIAFARQGHGDRARSLLDQAISVYERLEAARDLARAEAAPRRAACAPRTSRKPGHAFTSAGKASPRPSSRCTTWSLMDCRILRSSLLRAGRCNRI